MPNYSELELAEALRAVGRGSFTPKQLRLTRKAASYGKKSREARDTLLKALRAGYVTQEQSEPETSWF